jgi:wyosine [tRNA(Phe)-imidazoG37] synthetase (radical SAM superfamily)
MKQLQIRGVLILAVIVISVIKVTGQMTMPDVLLKSSLKDQYNYIEEHTRIYEDYRAIREDMFQKLKRNVSDTLSSINVKIAGLNKTVSVLNRTIDTLRTNLVSTQTRLDEMTKTKNSIHVAGIEVNKTTYNNSMWTILAGLIAILLIGFLAFKRNLSAMSNTKKEFQELKAEFETYRKTSREAREKLTMDHFNEIKRLKGGG